MTPPTLPTGYDRIKMVHSFDELVSTPFSDGVNAMCWQRALPCDFSEIVQMLVNPADSSDAEGIDTLDESRLASLPVSDAGRAGITLLLEDLRQLREHGLAPILDCIHGYPRDEDAGPVPVDVYSFHVDSATTETDTWLCTYHGPSSEGLRNDEAQRRVDVPETRAALLEIYGGEDDDDFAEYLNENCFDLHYAPAPGARPYTFGLGNLWRIAVQYPGSPVPPCIHRAPALLPGQPPRLLLIS